MREKIVKLNGLFFAYPRRENVLEDISFAIYKGEFLVLMGPNGAAKTTLLKLILGLLRPGRGTVEMARQIIPGYIPQKSLFNPGFPATVTEAVLVQAQRGNKNNRELVEQVLKRVDLWAKKDSLIGNLSGGQFQRMLIARSLINSPDILILDEPFTGLDARGQEEYLDLLVEFNQEGMTILMVTHDPAPVLPWASRLLYLSGGRVQERDKNMPKVV